MSNRTKPEEIVRAGCEIECAECQKPFKPKSVKDVECGICPACLSRKNQLGGKKVADIHLTKSAINGTRPKSSGRADTPYAHHHRGYRIIDKKKIYFANRMEANYYRYLLWLKKQKHLANFEYQPNPFDFRTFGIDQGRVTYRPDFLVLQFDGFCYYVEIKGHMNASSKTKLNRMRKYFPQILVEVVHYGMYKKLEKEVGTLIEGWET